MTSPNFRDAERELQRVEEIERMKMQDAQFRDEPIKSARKCADGGYEITGEDGWSFYVPSGSPVEPIAGSVARFYGRGVGHFVRGLAIDGVTVFYRSEAEERAMHEREAEERRARQGFDYEQKRGQYEARVAELPNEFQARIRGMRERGHRFRYEYESYELFVCEQAVAFALALKSPDALRAWTERPFVERRSAVPALSDDHSGNTFGAAVRLAHLFLVSPKLVEREHGAMCPLVRCKAHGCWSTIQESLP